MKRIVALLAVLFLSAAFAQAQTSTPNLQMTLPNYAQPNWNTSINSDLQILDTQIGNMLNPFLGAWSSTAIYSKGQQVSYGGALYISKINANFNNTPAVGSAAWQFYFNPGTASNPAGPSFAVNFANSGATGFQADPNITINPTLHSFTAPLVNGSVNTQVNAQMYGATGNCSTDDGPSIAEAGAAALTYSSGNTTPACVLLPKPVGGCYKVSTIHWTGWSWCGQPSGLANVHNGVIVQGMPGNDVLEVQDPTTNNYTWYGNWYMSDIGFRLDDSAPGSFPNRNPGRSFDDAGMAIGSNILTTTNGRISCADQGQAIQVNGAGSGGSNLVTTIATVDTCFQQSNSSNVKVTLAAANASGNTITNAHAYISVNGYPVTQTIGAAIIAFDNADGKPADWVNPGFNALSQYNKMTNVTFDSVSGSPQNNSAGLFTQGVWGLYGLEVDLNRFHGLVWPMSQTCAPTNSFYQSCANDYQTWKHVDMENVTNSILMYNGLDNTFEDLQLGANSAPQFIELQNTFGDFSDRLTVRHSGWEGGVTAAWRVMGQNDTFQGVGLTSGTATEAYLETSQSNFTGVGFFNGHMDGDNNLIRGSGNVIDNGMGNDIAVTGGITLFSTPNAGMYAGSPRKGLGISGVTMPDYLVEGNLSTPYSHNDLMFWPKEFRSQPFAQPYSTFYQPDATSQSGGYLIFNPGTYYSHWSQFLQNSTLAGQMLIGKNIPATSGNLAYTFKCSGSSSFTMLVGTGSTTLNTQSNTCNTSYQSNSMRVTGLSAYVGGALFFGTSVGTALISSAIYTPDVAEINGKNIPGAGPSFATGPETSVAGHVATYADAIGTMQDSGTPLSALAPLASPAFTNTPTAPTGGTCDGTPLQLANEAYVAACGVGGALTTITLNTSSNTDSGGVLTLSSATTASFPFTHGATGGAYTNIPLCVWTPKFNPGTATYWDTSSTSQAQITFSSAVTGSINYLCVVRSN